MPEYYAPGVHIEKESRGERYLEIVKTDCAVFLGMTGRGPVGKAVRISSFSEFKSVFGSFLPSSYLPYAVYGFFLNGGRECYIIRIAHINKRKSEEILTAAKTVLTTAKDNPLLVVRASSGGGWGNSISFEIKNSHTQVKTYPLSRVSSQTDSIKVANNRRFKAGDLVKIKSEEKTDTVELTEVSGSSLFFKKGSLKYAHDSGQDTEIRAVRYDIIVRCGDISENYLCLSPGRKSRLYFAEKINRDSKLVAVRPAPGRKGRYPKPAKYKLLGGKDGISTIIPDDYLGLSNTAGERIGLSILEELDEGRIVVMPDIHSHQNSRDFGGRDGVRAVIRGAIDSMENSKTRFLLLDPPSGLNIKEVMDWREDYDSSYAAMAYPWLKAKVYQSEEVLPMRIVPPSGYIAGLIARRDLAGGTHHSFANHELEGIVDTESNLTQFDSEILNPEGINSILAFPGRGIRAWGARTISSDPAYRFINVRRTFNMIAESIENGTQWVTFEPNSFELWESVKRLVFFFLKGLWKKGYLQGENISDAFYVKVDEENNPADVRDRGEMIVEVGVAIVRPAEFIIIRIAQKTLETQEK